MSRITILGGCGAVGSVAVKTLVALDEFSEIIIGDIDINKANKLVNEIGSEKVTAIKVDALDPNSVNEAIKDSDVVLNCTGPFYKFVKPILSAVIKAGINYVDICDDVDVTLEILEMDSAAKKAGISALIGIGSSPGVTNVLAKLSAEQFLDEIESVDFYHCHGGEAVEGAGVVFHRFHAMTIDIPMFLDGELKTVKFFEEDGIALQEDIDFHLIGKHKVYPYPHPEQVTIPKYIKGLKRVTNKGTVLPQEYFDLTMSMVKSGKTDDDAISYIIEQREKILKETNFGEQRGALKIVTKGKKKGKPHQYVFSFASIGQAMGEGTGIPAAFGAVLMNRGKIKEKGVLPPEACVNPSDFLKIFRKYFRLKSASDEKGGSPLIVESIDAEGNVKRIEL